MVKKKIVDLKKLNLEFIQKDETIKLLSFDTLKMSLEISIFKNEKFVKNSSMVFAHLPKSLKAKLNPK
ncbi:malate dehydrogenase [Aliarcobacter cryaerophilus]|uniref:Malate dehydrogenase n=1 Tax=Aliarcobacter cryaerophilus TaxID=28198 RepID=A0A2S9SW36_9BACT|nr:malate dehydrogenase [Aliarcobacter cryaerophilus]PRM90782.1 malate dehydrogenase [Aliarcobacter cryaerophilus]